MLVSHDVLERFSDSSVFSIYPSLQLHPAASISYVPYDHAFHQLNLSSCSLSMRCVFCFTALQGNDDWVHYSSNNVCALRGSTVDIICTYKYPYSFTVEKILWFNSKHNEIVDLKDDTGYTDRVEYNCDDPSCDSFLFWSTSCTGKCTLRIKGLTQSDSAVYKFRIETNKLEAFTGVPGVKLSVTGKS